MTDTQNSPDVQILQAAVIYQAAIRTAFADYQAALQTAIDLKGATLQQDDRPGNKASDAIADAVSKTLAATHLEQQKQEQIIEAVRQILGDEDPPPHHEQKEAAEIPQNASAPTDTI